MGSSYAKKKTRRVELGWMNYNEDDGEFKQVRAARGGLTRHVSIEKHTTVGELKTMAEFVFLFGAQKSSLRHARHLSQADR